MLFVDPKALTDRKAYDDFLQKLSELPVPSFLKTMKDNVVATGSDPESESVEDIEVLSEDGKVVKPKVPKFIKVAQKAIETGAEAVGKVGN